MLPKRVQLRREDDTVGEQLIEQRLLAGPVAREQQPLAPLVPDREGEHAVQTIEASDVPAPVGLENHFGVAVRLEDSAGAFELAADVAEVVDLAVEDDPAAAR